MEEIKSIEEKKEKAEASLFVLEQKEAELASKINEKEEYLDRIQISIQDAETKHKTYTNAFARMEKGFRQIQMRTEVFPLSKGCQ